MDWDKKMPSWDFSEVDSNAGPNFGPMAGPSTGLSVRAQDGPLDLKLGGSSSSGSSSKRARAPGPGGGPSVVSCLVDGCIADLRNCREYHRRHKVCEAHSKTPIVMVRGQQQRFCQQCSRFHLLVEFDEGKRSCRKRLDGHNRRRRKPQPESINSGSLFANHQGNRFTSYSQTFTSTITDLSWSNTAIKSEDPPLYAYQQPVHFLDPPHHFSPSSFTPSFNLQDSDTSLCQSFKRSDCALSLLSSPPVPPPATSSINQPPLLSYGGGLGLGQYSSGSHQALLDDAPESTTGFASSGMEGDENPTEMSCQVLFGEGSSDGGTQALPFSW